MLPPVSNSFSNKIVETSQDMPCTQAFYLNIDSWSYLSTNTQLLKGEISKYTHTQFYQEKKNTSISPLISQRFEKTYVCHTFGGFPHSLIQGEESAHHIIIPLDFQLYQKNIRSKTITVLLFLLNDHMYTDLCFIY